MRKATTSVPQFRGPSEHDDLAKAMGFFKAYIYKFFDSKQAISEVICSSNRLSTIRATVADVPAAA